MSTVIDLTGQKFGKLTVLERAENDRRGVVQWLCLCECGNTKVVRGESLKRHPKISCGCSRYPQNPRTGSRLYRIYSGMKGRCCNSNNPNWKNYGGRGITVCNEWLDETNGYDNFQKWAINNGYDESLSLDRIDVNGNYEPANCRWATRLQQQNNRTDNIKYSMNGVEKTVTEWANEYNIPRTRLLDRMSYGTWTLEEALTTPPHGRPHHKKQK